MDVYSRYSQNRKSGCAIGFEEEWIYQTPKMLLEVNLTEATDRLDGRDRIVFVEKGSEPMVCIYGRFPAPYQDYGLLYTSNLRDTLSSWRYMKDMLILIGVIVTFTVACCLMGFLEIIFRPLQQISKTSSIIANGDYHSRLPVLGKDEVADMSRSFNLMAEKVEAHIRLLQDTADKKQRFIDNFAHSTRWTFSIDAVTGELFDTGYGEKLNINVSLAADAALAENYSTYAQLAKNLVVRCNLLNSPVSEVIYNCQGYSGNNPDITLEVIGENGNRVSVTFSRFNQKLSGIITDSSKRITDSAWDDAVGEAVMIPAD